MTDFIYDIYSLFFLYVFLSTSLVANMEFTTEKMLFFIETLRKCGKSAVEIHNYLSEAWPQEAVSLRRVQQITKEYNDGERNSFSRMHGSGRPQSERRTEHVNLIEAALEEDPTRSVRFLASRFNISQSMVQRILQSDLERIWMLTQWVPHTLSEQHKESRVTCCNHFIESFQSRLVRKNLITIDEKWFYARNLQPRNKIGAWVSPGGDQVQTAIRKPMETKFLAIIAVSIRGEHYFKMLCRKETLDSDGYIQFLRELEQHLLRRRIHPLRMENVYLIHDNATCHKSRATEAYLQAKSCISLKTAGIFARL